MTSTVNRAATALRRSFAIEAIVATAIALTLLAVWFREPLTTRRIELGPQSQGKLFYAYNYGDQPTGGNSTVTADPKNPLALSCLLGSAYEWPYCGLGLLFDLTHQGKGFDLSGYGSIALHLSYQGSATYIRVAIKDHDPRYRALRTMADKVNEATYPVRNGDQLITLNLADFAVAEWWKNETHASGELARPSFRNVIAMELIAGNDGKTGLQQMRIEGISITRQIVSAQLWYGAIAACWLLLIGGILLFRRRQMASLRKSSEDALRTSEQLYRGIMQASTDAIVLLDSDGYVHLVNDAAFEAMELDSAERVLDKHWTRLWRDESGRMVSEHLERAERDGTSRFRAFCATSKGTPKWWDVVIAAMYDEDGALKGMLTISRDITREREKSEQLQWASMTRSPSSPTAAHSRRGSRPRSRARRNRATRSVCC